MLIVYAGPGMLTRSLLKLPPSRVKKVIVLEDQPAYLKYLKVCSLLLNSY